MTDLKRGDDPQGRFTNPPLPLAEGNNAPRTTDAQLKSGRAPVTILGAQMVRGEGPLFPVSQGPSPSAILAEATAPVAGRGGRSSSRKPAASQSAKAAVSTDWKTEAFATMAIRLDKVLGGPTAKAFLALNCETVGDLLHLLPRHLMSGTDVTNIADLIGENRGSEEYVAVLARVGKHSITGQAPKQRLEVHLTDGRVWLTATFFGRLPLLQYWDSVLDRSTRGIFAGKLGWFNKLPQLTHPAFAMICPDGLVGSEKSMKLVSRMATDSFLGLYPQTSKLPTWAVAECIDLALDLVTGLSDPLPAWVREEAGLCELEQALRQVHLPTSTDSFEQGKKRLLFDEAFATQVAMAYRREDASTHTAVARMDPGSGLVAALDARLPFELTAEQVQAGVQISADLARTRPMQRLLQGEVGSGKTVVALRAMLTVVDTGGQAVLIAPTEVLAQQHTYSVRALLGDLATSDMLSGGQGTDVVLLTGSMTASVKADVLGRIASGQAGIIIGTHALLSRGVTFHDLGLVVVDEQHRFGVEQRTSLLDQAAARPHVLVMTATPIPRSVAMTIFGDLDVSTLTQIPTGRAEVTTTVVDVAARPAWVDRAWARVSEEVAKGRQVYIVAPRIDPSGGKEGSSVLELASSLSRGPLHGLRIAVLHGRLPGSEKTEIMARFGAGDLDVLVATSMIEVGVDQPNASMMVISDAERFGISQLHQLRGRIGRGAHPGVCLLLTNAAEGTPARQRLDMVAHTRDGFALAETDLAQRREGDVLGMSQSGRRSSLKLLRVLDHVEIIVQARHIADEVVRRDPGMSHPGIADYVADIESRADADLDEST
ncbi:MAG: ATP-dependent DNA helicase RecG [Propionibacteriaceae bacterium]|nr:ATP-dependent DNA helicase RecG [Propionibacteriaceae bacterium]